MTTNYTNAKIKAFLFVSHFNSFVPNALFLFPLKTPENRKVFWCFQGIEKGCIGNEWDKPMVRIFTHEILKRFEYLWWFEGYRAHARVTTYRHMNKLFLYHLIFLSHIWMPIYKCSTCAKTRVSSKLKHEYQLQQQLHFQTSGTQRHEDTDLFQKTDGKLILVSSWQIYYCFCKWNSPNIDLFYSINMIEVTKKMNLKKSDLTARVVFTKYWQFCKYSSLFMNGA